MAQKKTNKINCDVFLVGMRFLLILFLLLLAIGCNVSQDNDSGDSNEQDNNPQPQQIDENQLLNDTFRIDIKKISVTFDVKPQNNLITGHAVIEFRMRSEQKKAIIHFNPKKTNDGIDTIQLNGESLDPSIESDVKQVTFDCTTQKGLEFQRDLGQNIDHILEITYHISFPNNYKSLYTEVNDILGVGNEILFPTINSPRELARHIITFQVHGSTEYTFIGSGLVQKLDSEEGLQEWVLNTERPVASYTVMFCLIPKEDVNYKEKVINNVNVRAMAYVGGASINKAFNELETWLPKLEADFGPYPIPRGLSIFLVDIGGMEYYGAAFSDLSVLRHEVFHMYFGCTTIARTYRDSWFDEAINIWYEYGADPISDNFQSDIVSSRTPASVGFDPKAYAEGSQIMEAVAVAIGGNQKMVEFLKYLHKNDTFSPFNTFDFVNYLKDFSGVDMYEKFLKWIYNDRRIYTSMEGSSFHEENFRVDMTPPLHIRQKY